MIIGSPVLTSAHTGDQHQAAEALRLTLSPTHPPPTACGGNSLLTDVTKLARRAQLGRHTYGRHPGLMPPSMVQLMCAPIT